MTVHTCAIRDNIMQKLVYWFKNLIGLRIWGHNLDYIEKGQESGPPAPPHPPSPLDARLMWIQLCEGVESIKEVA